MKKIITIFIIVLLLSWTVFGVENGTSDGTNDTQQNTQQNQSAYACDDGRDNDGDGFIDFDGNGDESKKDLGCFGPADNDESGGTRSPATTNSNNQTSASASGGGSGFPWGIAIGLAAPALFLIAGLAGDDEEAAAKANTELANQAKDQVVAQATGDAPAAVKQAFDIAGFAGQLQQGVGVQQLAIGVAQEQAITTAFNAACATPTGVEFCPAVQTYLQVKGGYDKAKELGFDEPKGDKKAGHFIVRPDGTTDFENINFKGKDNAEVDASRYMLDADTTRENKVKVNLKGFNGGKKDGFITLNATAANQRLVITGSDGKKRIYEGMKEGSVIKLNDKGEIIEADITVGADQGSYVFGNAENSRMYKVPKGAKVKYKDRKVIISGLESEEATLTLPNDDGNFDDKVGTKNFKIKADGNVIVEGNAITGDDAININYGDGESLDVTTTYDRPGQTGKELDYSLKIEEGKGIVVDQGIAFKNGLVFDVDSSNKAVLLVNSNVDNVALEDYTGSWIRKTDINLDAVSASGGVVEFKVVAEDDLFKSEEAYDSLDLRFSLGGGSTLNAVRDSTLDMATVTIDPFGGAQIINGQGLEPQVVGITPTTGTIERSFDVLPGRLYTSSSGPGNAIPMIIEFEDSRLKQNGILIKSDGATSIGDKDLLVRTAMGEAIPAPVDELVSSAISDSPEFEAARARLWGIVDLDEAERRTDEALARILDINIDAGKRLTILPEIVGEPSGPLVPTFTGEGTIPYDDSPPIDRIVIPDVPLERPSPEPPAVMVNTVAPTTQPIILLSIEGEPIEWNGNIGQTVMKVPDDTFVNLNLDSRLAKYTTRPLPSSLGDSSFKAFFVRRGDVIQVLDLQTDDPLYAVKFRQYVAENQARLIQDLEDGALNVVEYKSSSTSAGSLVAASNP